MKKNQATDKPGILPPVLYDFFLDAGSVTKFAGRFFRELVMPPYEFNEFLKQSYNIGNKTLPLVAVTGFIMGLVLTIQSRPTLADFGAVSWLPAMVTVSVIREIGPVITALICAGKIGSGMGAELASMKETEQIDAMEVSGINPFKYIVVTRILASTLMVPLLVVFADAIAMFGSYLAVNIEGDVSYRLFISQSFEKLYFSDVLPALVKTFFFGFVIGLIGCFKGYTNESGAEGVGRSANNAVVFASLMVFIIDMIAVQFTSILYE
jgi:phospholipid/cholesterol/gamma-HCH transport system permease protein